jgi:prepilin-type N-terminal cleavage/methylation domain-containing protein
MFQGDDNTRRGMSLVELLVVVAILSVLAVTVIPLLANSAESRKTREAARAVVSYVAQSQNRVLGRTEWGGFWMIPVASTNYALDLAAADVPQIFQGDDLPTTVVGTGTTVTISGTAIPVFVTRAHVLATSGSIGGTTVSGSVGDLVRFDGTGPWYALATATGTMVTLRSGSTPLTPILENANQTTLNTPWPAPNVPLTYELMRQPLRSGSPLPLGGGRCVDVAESGYDGTGGYTAFGNNPGDIAVLFDGTGRLRQLIVGQKRVTPMGGVFLLVGRPDRAVASPPMLVASDDSTGSNWQYADSYWIGIDPLTGVTKLAECTVGAAAAAEIAAGKSPLTASQSYIRSELLASGR